jgi:hypothetical protein
MVELLKFQGLPFTLSMLNANIPMIIITEKCTVRKSQGISLLKGTINIYS